MLYLDEMSEMAYDKILSEDELNEKVNVFTHSSDNLMSQIKNDFNDAYGNKHKSFAFPLGMEGAFLLHPAYSMENSRCEFTIGHYLKSTQYFTVYENTFSQTRFIRLGYIKEDEKNHIFIFGV